MDREPLMSPGRGAEPNHEEALSLASLRQDDSNLARCYIELSSFVRDDLPLVLTVLYCALEELSDAYSSELKIDIEKAVNSLEGISSKAKGKQK